MFDSQETGQFPHYSDDLRSLPTHLQRLLSHKPRSRGRASTLKDSGSPSSSSHGERERENRLPCGSATNPEDRGLKTEMNRTEGYHIHTNCVQLAFVDSYTHQATLRTTSFVDDFPVHVWVFIPPSLLDKSLANQEPALPAVPPTTLVGGAHSDKVHDAMISFVAHAPQPIKAQLERLQLLFVMRLKDSFTEFKNSLMRFLVLPSANESTSKNQSEKEKGGERRDGERERGLPESEGKLDERMLEKSTVRGSTPTSMLSSGSESDVSATISGCVIVESVEACIVLPSILKAHGLSSSGSPSVGATSPKSPSTPLAGGTGGNKKLPSVTEAAMRAENAIRVPKSGSGNGILESKNGNQYPKKPIAVDLPLSDGGVANHFSDRTQVSMPHPSQGSQTGLSTNMTTHASLQSGLSSQTGLSMSAGGSATPSPRISPAPSQTSLASQTSQSSQLSLPLSNNMSNTHSPSITSLPTLIESSGNKDSLSGLTQSFNHPRGTPVPSSLGICPPMRSLSASHLPPSVAQGNAITVPHPTATPHGRNSTSLVHDRRSSTPQFQERHSSSGVYETTREYNYHIAAASQMVERESQSERSSPVVHATSIGGTGTVIETQYENKALWSESPHDESDFVMVERMQHSMATGTCKILQD